MKKITELIFVVLGIASFILIAGERGLAQYTESSECSKQMAKETERYMRENKIAFAAATSEFHSSKNEQIYILSSEAKVNLNVSKPPKRIIAVVNHKVDNKNAGFYVIESEFQRDSVVYTIKRNSEVLHTIPLRMLKPQPDGTTPTDPYCDKIKAESVSLAAVLQKEANDTCNTLRMCFPICSNSQIIGYAMHIFKPQGRWCDMSEYPYAQSRLYGLLVDATLEKDVSLFRYEERKNLRN